MFLQKNWWIIKKCLIFINNQLPKLKPMYKFSIFRLPLCLLMLLTLCNYSNAQSRSNQLIQVLVTPNKADWTYAPNEEITFTVDILKNQVPLKEGDVTYTIGWEKMEPLQSGVIHLKKDNTTVGKPIKTTTPGFMRCEVKIKYDGEEYRGIATAAITPELIKPTQILPNDFLSFWNKEIKALNKIPLNTKLKLLPEKSTSKVDIYEVSFQNINNSRIYGILARPKKTGKYPAILQVPGAGIRPYEGMVQQAENGFVTLQIGIHGISVTNELELYQSLSSGALRSYPFFNLDDINEYYYKRVYLGCIRAVDFLCSLEDVDTNNLLVWGGSQGGALSIVTAALDNRIKNLVALYPALSDLTGYLQNRAGGWPHMFNKQNAPYMATETKIKNSAYYDVVNFAKHLKVPGFYTWGYNDETCPPTSYYSAYNEIKAPKDLYLVQETGHWSFPEQQTKIMEWVLQKTKANP